MGTPWPQDNFFFQDPNTANLNNLATLPQTSPPPLPLPHHPDDSNANSNPPHSIQNSIHSHHQPYSASYPTSSPSIPIAVDRAQPPPIAVSLAPPLYTTPSSNDAFSQRYVTPAAQPTNNYPFTPFSGGAMPPALPPLPIYGMTPRRAPLIPGVHRGGSGSIGKSSSLADIITPNSVRVSPLSLSRQPVNTVQPLPDDDEDDWQPDTRVGRQRVMTKCPQCGHENHIRRKICLNCQAPKPPPAKRKRRRRRKSTLARQRAAAAAAAAVARYELGPPHTSGVTFPPAVSLQPLAGPLNTNPPLHTLPPPGSLGTLPDFHRRNP